MRIGILVTGRVHEELEQRHGDYAAMFEALLGRVAPDFTFRAWYPVEGELPESVEACDGWLVTGSKHGVYDDLPWIAPLRQFLARARAAGRPIVGVCFGHQILAEALGGAAAKSERGWGVGLRRYRVLRRPSWMADAPDELAIHALHQDQVTEIPGDATVLAESDHCPFAMLAYGDPELPDAISIQPHPEFAEDYLRELVRMRSGVAIPPETAEAALASLGAPTDAERVAHWCVAYFRRAATAAPAA